MIAVLKEAAEKAAAACDDDKSIDLRLTEDGIVLFGRVENERAGYTFVQQVDWGRFEIQPQFLLRSIDLMAEKLLRRATEMSVIRIAPRGEQPAVRPIGTERFDRFDWGIIGTATLTIALCVPLLGGIWP